MMSDILKLVLFNFRYTRSYFLRIPFVAVFPLFMYVPALFDGGFEHMINTVSVIPFLFGVMPMMSFVQLSQQAQRDRILIPVGMKEKFIASLIVTVALFLLIMVSLGLGMCLVMVASQFTETPVYLNPFYFLAKISMFEFCGIWLLTSIVYLASNYFKNANWTVTVSLVCCMGGGGLWGAYGDVLSQRELTWVVMAILTVVCFYFSYRCFLTRNYGEVKMNIVRPV